MGVGRILGQERGANHENVVSWMLAKFTWYTSSLIIALIFPVSVGIGLDCLAAAIIAHVTTEMAAYDRRDTHRWTQREKA